ncbi:hypothetical protein GCM10009757_36080 [Streptomyces cheonanensis]|uniref:Uncharacterized protein n=1 Tax=Streptomyces cheonanensis TaxID=312720 RepID=A0ABP5GU17_9ACTN
MKETGEQAKPKTSSTTPATPATPATTRPARAPLSLHHLQRTAGNAAVSRLVAQRYTPPVKPPPAQAPGMRRVNADIGAKKQKLAAHPAPTAESRAAQDAAVAPPDDRQAQAKTQQAEKMNAAEPGDFDKAAFIAAVNQAVEAQAPKNLDEADKFSDSGNADRIKDEVDGKVADGKDTSSEDIATATGETPDTSNTTEKDVTPLTADQPPGNPGAPNAGDAVPDRQPEEVTDFSEGQRDTEQRMAEADVTEEQLARGNEPDFDHALAEKKQGEEETAAAPAQARAAENTELQTAKSGAAAAGAQAMAGLTATREATGRQVDSGKTETKSADEQKREQVTATLQKVFDRTKTDVEKILDSLDGKVDTQFTNGEKRARDAFTADHERRMKAYKDKRYSGLRGKARWVKDKFAGLPEEANGIYQESRKLYVNQMQGVISDIADTIGRELGRAKTRIGQGRAELQAEVGKLPADLRRFGEEAAQDFAGQFDDLETQVDEKSEQLVQDLAQKYTEALDAIDEEITALQEANKGLWDRVKDAVVGVIQTIIELTNALMGILAKAASAVSKIIKDPIGFLGNVVRYVGDGLNLFTANIEQHLKTGLVSWLLGTAVKTGLQIPAKFDAKGIVQLLASLLGLTWDTIRAKIVRKGVPDKAMATVEKSIPEAQALQREGPAGLTKEITGESGDLKKTILDDLKSYLIPTVIVAGIAWIVSLLTPASAFVRAVKGIIDIVTFIVTQAAQITDFMNAILDAVIAIANGAASGVPKLIESALSTSIPLLLGFLAALLGIGSLATKVRSVFQKVSRPVGRAIDKIITRIAKKAKSLWRQKGRESRGNDGSDTARSRNVKQQARRMLTQSSSASLEDDRALDSLLDRILRTLRPKGLKTMTKKFVEGSPGRYDIVATASPPEKIGAKSTNEQIKNHIKEHLHGHGRKWVAEKVHPSWWQVQVQKPEINDAKVWPSISVLNGTESKGVKYLQSEDSAYAHATLVNYFKSAPGKRSADTAEFSDFVFKKEDRNPVRNAFLDQVGEEAVGELRETGKKRVNEIAADADDTKILGELDRIRFRVDISNYGKFEPFLRDGADPDLMVAVQEAGGIVQFLEGMLRSREVNGITKERFEQLWNKGGATVAWLKDQFRAKMPGHHEWIPSNMILEVLDAAISHFDAGRVQGALDWLLLHNELRSRTNLVIWKRPEGLSSPPAGHVGSFYHKDEDKSVLTDGTEAFHDALREIFRANLTGDPAACLDKIFSALGVPQDGEIDGSHEEGLVWSGSTLGLSEEVLKMPIGVRYKLATKVFEDDFTVGQLAAQQRRNVAKIENDFDRVRKLLQGG